MVEHGFRLYFAGNRKGGKKCRDHERISPPSKNNEHDINF